MGKRAPKLPVASAGGGKEERLLAFSIIGRKVVAITDSDWQRIEKAYGQKLSPKARRDIHEKTQEFVDRAEFEQNAEPVSDARDRITPIIEAASSLRSAIDSGIHDADIYACSLIKKHLWKQSDAKKQKEGDAIKRRRLAYSISEICALTGLGRDAVYTAIRDGYLVARKLGRRTLITDDDLRAFLAGLPRAGGKDDPLRKISSDLRVLIFASQDALRELDDAKDQGFSKGEAWDRWVGVLTSIAKEHNLPGGVRKDVDKQSEPQASPFVEFVWELQQSMPKEHRRAQSKEALAVAVVAARRRNRVG